MSDSHDTFERKRESGKKKNIRIRVDGALHYPGC